MKFTIGLCLSVLVLLAFGGCKQQESSAPVPAPVVAPKQEQTVKEEPPAAPVVAERSSVSAVNKPVAPVSPSPASPPPAPPVAAVKPAAAQPPAAAVAPEAKPTPAVAAAPAAIETKTPAKKTESVTPAAAKTVTYPATNGAVTFAHARHAADHPCSSCHPTDPPTMIVIDKTKAHELCKGCHQQKGSGPTQCAGCHKKG